MKKIIFLFSVLFLSIVIKAQEIKYRIDTENSNIYWKGFKVLKTDATSHNGIIRFKEGYLKFKESLLVGGEFVADMNSISTQDIKDVEGKEKLDTHLKSVDFFDVENYPITKFEISKIEKAKEKGNKFNIKGNLTIRGITKSIKFLAEIKKGKEKILFRSNKIKINRQNFNVKYISSIKDMLIKDEFELEIEVLVKPFSDNL